MSTRLSHADTPLVGIRALRASPVIVATDGRQPSDAALAAGLVFAGEPDGLRVMTVVRPLAHVSPDAAIAYTPEVDAARRADRMRSVIDQMERTWGDPELVVPEVYDGDAATRIAAAAHMTNAALIVAGLGRHRVIDRVFGDETALRLIRMAAVPVLAVAPGLTHAPRCIVVAIDFSETSLRAARMALELAAPEATVYLAHVVPRDTSAYDWSGIGTSYREDAGYALQKTALQLHVPDGITLQRILLHGDPATELLAFASSVKADVIATGSHGHGFVTRMLIGSVTTRIVRCATCSVLSVPHQAVMTRIRTTAEPPTAAALDRSTWASELDAFSRRNAGRRGVLEVDDPEIGAQAQENDYPLLGAAYDPHDERVELMFGGAGDVTRHLTRGIGGVTRIDVLRNDEGRDLALRVGHGIGQTILTFAD